MTDDTDYYDSISEGYGELYGEEQLRKAEIILRHIRPKREELLLDVGCGSGIYFPNFWCSKVGIDPSIELLRKAEDEEAVFIQARAENIPFRDRAFDYVISVTAVHNFGDVDKGLGEIARVAKKTVVLSILRQAKQFGEIEVMIGKLFSIRKMILDEKDIIFVLEKKAGNDKEDNENSPTLS
jgi:ubiquinone/menaquinone biosynthesis C-methylase UbiE